MAYPADELRRWMFRAPITLWRLGLGPVIGPRFMLITHTGRSSGLPRRAIVEYATWQAHKYAIAAWGDAADWVKNITADPRVTVQTHIGTERMCAVRETGDEALRHVYAAFMRVSPVMFNWYLTSLEIEANPNAVVAHKDRLSIWRFDPTAEPTPPPVEADLTWVWPVLTGGLGFALFARWLRR